MVSKSNCCIKRSWRATRQLTNNESEWTYSFSSSYSPKEQLDIREDGFKVLITAVYVIHDWPPFLVFTIDMTHGVEQLLRISLCQSTVNIKRLPPTQCSLEHVSGIANAMIPRTCYFNTKANKVQLGDDYVTSHEGTSLALHWLWHLEGCSDLFSRPTC